MAEIARYSGLCETCDHDSTCTLRRSTLLKIIECEEFSIHSSTPEAAAPESAICDNAGAGVLGICANCLNVATCGFPNARRGVLQCEEYILDEAGVIPAVQVIDFSKSAA
jgi:hypothetical protein